MAIISKNIGEPSRFRTQPSLNRVPKIFFGPAGTTQGGFESSRQPVIPPAPLTGDVGRGCGDASRALLLFSDIRMYDAAGFHVGNSTAILAATSDNSRIAFRPPPEGHPASIQTEPAGPAAYRDRCPETTETADRFGVRS
jgi:hypothetical protein